MRFDPSPFHIMVSSLGHTLTLGFIVRSSPAYLAYFAGRLI